MLFFVNSSPPPPLAWICLAFRRVLLCAANADVEIVGVAAYPCLRRCLCRFSRSFLQRTDSRRLLPARIIKLSVHHRLPVNYRHLQRSPGFDRRRRSSGGRRSGCGENQNRKQTQERVTRQRSSSLSMDLRKSLNRQNVCRILHHDCVFLLRRQSHLAEGGQRVGEHVQVGRRRKEVASLEARRH